MTWHIVNWMAGSILALAWFSRIVDAALGMPHIVNITLPEWDRKSGSSGVEPRVSIIVPARNEEEHIRETLSRLLTLEYSNYEIIAIDDRSTDRTGQIMDEVVGSCGADTSVRLPAAPAQHAEAGRLALSEVEGNARPTRLKVIHISGLPPGWLGKTHAMWKAAQQATGDWLLFTDADVLFKPDALRRAIAYADAEKADHLVVFPRMIMERPDEKMMMAFFQTLIVFGHRPWKVADPRARDHMGVGAFNLVRCSVYEAVGTYQALCMEILDDMKLGKVVKNAGFAQRVVFGQDLISLRWAKGAFGIVDNLTKNFFALLSFQWWRTLASVFAVGFLNLGPFLGIWLTQGWARVPYALALASIFLIYWGMSTKSAVRSGYFFLHPISASLFMYTLMRSMFHTLWNDGIVWRGTKYALEELRNGRV